MHGGFNTKPSTLQLYTELKEAGRGLVIFRATIQHKATKIQKYIRKMIPSDELESECLQDSPAHSSRT